MHLILSKKLVLLIASIILLAITKLAEIVHIDLESHYLDIDRFIALFLFLLIYNHFFTISRKSLLIFIVGFGVMLLIGLYFKVAITHIFAIYVLTSLVEEILIRAVIIELLVLKFNAFSSVILSALIFSLVHPDFYNFEIYSLLVFGMGVVFSILYLYIKKHGIDVSVAVLTILHGVLVVFYLYS